MKHTIFTRIASLLLAGAMLFSCSSGDTSVDGEVTGEAENAVEAVEETETDRYPDSKVQFTDYSDIAARKTAGTKSGMSELELNLTFDGRDIPHAGTKYYLTIDDDFTMDDLRSIECGNDTAEILLDAHMKDIDPSVIMKHGTEIEVFTFVGESYAYVTLYLTSLPVMTIDANGKSVSSTTTDRDCTMTISAARDGAEKTYYVESEATIRVRGASSASLDKVPYKVELVKDGEANKLPLLGMRNDDDWILYATYSDYAHVRDVTGWHIWDQMTEGLEYRGVLEMRYVELILNDEYYGLFVLMEKFDGKTLDLNADENDSLFKCISWDIPDYAGTKTRKNSTESYSSLELKFPDAEENETTGWQDIANFFWVSYETSGDEFKENVANYVNIENQVDYWLFLNVTMAADNTSKNTYYANIDGKTYSFPWDLDITFGLGWTGDINENYLNEDDGMSGRTYDYQCGRRLIKYVDEAREYLVERWDSLRESGVLDADNIIAYATEQWDLLHNSGAWDRNEARWPNGNNTDNLDFFSRTVKSQLNYLDDYIDDLR